MFKGLRHPISSSEAEVWQFRGIKYGNLPSRFKQSILNETFPDVSDATTYGPKCPQSKVPLRIEDGIIGLPPSLARHAEDIYDEFNCLHLNITTPANSPAGLNLPVMVYIHGGGGRGGSNSDWWNDGGSLVKKSIEIRKPVIHVAINFRLAVLGYLGSIEFRKENGNANGGNYGYCDMHTAIAWIHSHITPFGGDPSNITLYGESAGSYAVNAQMHSLLPAHFVRVISLSQTMGTPLLSTPHSISEKDAVYEAIKKHLKLTTLKEMETVPWQDLLAAYQVCDPKHALGEQVMVDGEFIDENWADRFSFAGDGKGEVMLGNTGAEGTAVTIVLRGLPTVEPKPTTSAIIAALSSVAPYSKISPILCAYNITPTSTQSEIAAALLAVVEDIMWYRAASSLSRQLRARGTTVYEYSFEQLQSFTGPFKGVAGHSLDLAYLHGDPGIFSYCAEPAKEIAIQDSMRNAWIGFANGERPWEENKTRVFGPRGKTMDLGSQEVLGALRRGKAWETLDGLTIEELTALSGVVVRFYGQLVSSS